MEANLITVVRILLVFVVIGIYQINFYLNLLAVCLTILVLSMDALDGILARKLGISSDLGALFDIVGDRIVENVFWVYFSAISMVSFWAASIVIARSFLVDWLRTMAFAQEGKTPFGEKTMLKESWARALASSRFSRALYGISKAVVFVYLGALLVLESGRVDLGWSISPRLMGWLYTGGSILVWTTVVMCLVRGIPVVWDSRDILTQRLFPGLVRD